MDNKSNSSINKNTESEKLLKKIKEENRRKFIKKNKTKLIVGLFSLLVLLVVFLVIKIFYYDMYKVKSINMSETINYEDTVLIKKSYDKVEVGKIYEFFKDDKKMIARCIAVGGDHVKISNDKVYINNIELVEPYISSKATEKINIDVLVPENKYFFLGDNRKESWDSRYWSEKFVDKEDIIGEVIKIIFPRDRSKELN